MEKITVALPKGRLFEQTLELFSKANIIEKPIQPNSRKLIVENENFRFLLVRSKDVPTYVEMGVADLGVAGDDVLLETEAEIYKPVDLGIGYCNIIVAGLPESKDKYFSNPTSLTVATKYPKITTNFFAEKGIKIQMVELYGSIELAPLVGLSEYIVDIVETGTTLRENGLVVIDEIRPSSAKLIANRVSYKTKTSSVLPIVESLENYLLEATSKSII
jgi:ATP phosphoribosyltransferase